MLVLPIYRSPDLGYSVAGTIASALCAMAQETLAAFLILAVFVIAALMAIIGWLVFEIRQLHGVIEQFRRGRI